MWIAGGSAGRFRSHSLSLWERAGVRAGLVHAGQKLQQRGPERVARVPHQHVRGLGHDTHVELGLLRFQQASGQLENTARRRQVRRDIARLKLILSERRPSAKAPAA